MGDRQSLIAVTIKQLNGADRVDDNYIVDNRELHTVQLLGTMHQLQEHSTNIIFVLNDSTGTLECKQWIEKESAKHKKLTGIKYVLISIVFYVSSCFL